MRLNLFCLFLIATTTCWANDPLYDAFRSPSLQNRPFVRWWWNGGRVNATELVRELDVMKAAGIGGVEINTIGMPESATPASLAAHLAVAWLSPEWNQLVRTVADAARDRGMVCDLIVGSGWPFGGRFLQPSEQTQRVLLVKKNLRGPTQVTYSRTDLLTPPSDSPDQKPNVDEHPPTSSELLFVRLVPASTAVGDFSPGRELLTTSDRIEVEVPTGEFELYVGIRQTGFTHVKLGAPGADGPVVNHFDAAAVRKYLEHMSGRLSPALNGNLGSALRAMFVDSLELDHANWTGDFQAEFRQRRGYELVPYLPFVLEDDRPPRGPAFNDTIRRARYDFDRTLVELFDERFLRTYVDWAHANGVKARIQAYGRETHPLDGSLNVDLPEGETWLWVDKLRADRIRVESTVVNKYVSSAANLTGQRVRSFEAMTNAVPVFRETLQDFKRGMDASVLSGLNHPILHGFNYTPLDAGFPGWVRFGSYLNERTPWWPYFRHFSDYAVRLGTVMRQSEARARVAMLAPRPDEWSKHGLLYQPFPEVSDPWYQFKLIDAIQQAGYNADYISEKILIGAKKQEGKLRFGPCAYDVLILEDVRAIEPAAAEALAEFVRTGGRVVVIGEWPTQAPGLPQATEADERVQAAIAEIHRAKDRVWHQPAPINAAERTAMSNEQVLLDFAAQMLAETSITPDVQFDQLRPTVSQIHHQIGERALYFIVNANVDQPVRIAVTFPGAKGQPYLWYPETGDKTALPMQPDGRVELDLEPTGSALVVFSPEERPFTPAAPMPSHPATSRELLQLTGPWKLLLQPAGGAAAIRRELPRLVDLSRQQDDPELVKFGGQATYETVFNGSDSDDAVLDLGEVHDISDVTLNGKSLGVRWWGRHRYSLAGKLKPGSNLLQIKVTTMLVNLMRHKTDDAAAQRWAGWAPPIPTGLIGPVRVLTQAQAADGEVNRPLSPAAVSDTR